MGSFYHKLKGNKARQMPTHFVVYDTETKPEKVSPTETKHHLKLGVACKLTRVHGQDDYKETWKTFHSIDDFWKFVLKYVRKKSCLYLIAHNQHFDFPVVNGFNYLVDNNWEMSRPILDSKLFMVTFQKDTRRIKVLDSLNWFKFSLRTLGKYLGVTKLDIDFDSCTDRELEVYCRRDVEILKAMLVNWIEFLRENDLGNFNPTVASQAFSAYRHRFMHYRLWIHSHPKVTELERDSYRGGRCECFRLGEINEPVYVYDYNSLYPYVMKEHTFPTKLVKYVEDGDLLGLRRFLSKYQVIARVKVSVREPFLAKNMERLTFPVGEFAVTLTTPELKYTLKHGEILDVYDYAVYEHAPIFKTYVEALYRLRRWFKSDGNLVYDLLTKLLLNSLYGKFGQLNEEIKEIGECKPNVCSYERIILADGLRKYLKWKFGGKIYVRYGEKTEWKHSFVAIASHVSAYARMKLWRGIKRAGRENVYYVDTDSLIVNNDGKARLTELLSTSVLGKLKREAEAQTLEIFGLKDYRVGDKVRTKGIREDAKQIAENVYEQRRYLKFRSLLKAESLHAPIVETIRKTLRREYKKGVVLESGKVIPFQLS